MTAAIPRGDALALTRALVAIDSRNPSLDAAGPGESTVATTLAAVLRAWGFQVELHEALPGRPNVLARLGPGTSGRTLLLNGHLDTVGVEGMTHAPFDPTLRDGRLYGRGATDMKAGVAAMCAAAVHAADAGIGGELLVTAVIDEEYGSVGTRHLLQQGIRAEAAIVTEPTRLAICPSHKGFTWAEVTVHGRAAHGSRYEVGVDAIAHAAHLIAELDAHQQGVLTGITHPLLGRASLHAGTIRGGTGPSTYAERCTVTFERRTLPGERATIFAEELEDAIARVRARHPGFVATVQMGLTQQPNDLPVTHPVVRALEAACAATGHAPRLEGLSCWTDAALLSAAGIPALCFGPGDIALAHAAEEWVAVAEIAQATAILTELIGRWDRDAGDAWRR
ncbi:MAG: hypothetical protein RLZZ25_564 [Gemmatimonadota bacterium]|jgi:acetylornithine deacetylase